MFANLQALKSLIKAKSYHIDYPLFRLHYQATVGLLLAFCLILTAKVLFGDTIDCASRIVDRNDFYDNFCYSEGTFTSYAIDDPDLRLAIELQRDSGSVSTMSSLLVNSTVKAYPNLTKRSIDAKTGDTYNNVFPYQILSGTNVGEFLKSQFRNIHGILKNNHIKSSSSIKYLYSGIMVPRPTKETFEITFWHQYYQYMPVILFLQAVFFYFPHYLWKNWENGVISSICKQLHDNRFSPSEYIKSNSHMIDYLENCFLLNKSLVYKYYLCNVFLLVNLVSQITILNAIFNNLFITYGIDVFHYLFIDKDIYGLRGTSLSATDELNNPMNFIFPKITGCTLQVLSQAGPKPDTLQFLCVLPLNILHDKFFLILWFWFLVLIVLTIIQLIYDFLYITTPMMRTSLFKRRFGPYLSEKNWSSLSEIFLLDLIGSNSDKFAFAALLKRLNKLDWQASPSDDQSLV